MTDIFVHIKHKSVADLVGDLIYRLGGSSYCQFGDQAGIAKLAAEDIRFLRGCRGITVYEGRISDEQARKIGLEGAVMVYNSRLENKDARMTPEEAQKVADALRSEPGDDF